MAKRNRKRTIWTEEQKEKWHLGQKHMKKNWFNKDGSQITGWCSQETVDDTIWFGNSFVEHAKTFTLPDDIGDLAEIFPEEISAQDSKLLIRMLIRLFPSDDWESYVDAKVQIEDIWLMSKIISAKLFNGKCVKTHFVSDRDLEEQALANI